jgi:hypothetical protein
LPFVQGPFRNDVSPRIHGLKENRDMSMPNEDAFLDQVVDGKFTIRELHAAFAKVQNPEGWKMAIRARIDAADMEVVECAIPFMTGSVANFQDLGNGVFLVRAAGYYACIGS